MTRMIPILEVWSHKTAHLPYMSSQASLSNVVRVILRFGGWVIGVVVRGRRFVFTRRAFTFSSSKFSCTLMGSKAKLNSLSSQCTLVAFRLKVCLHKMGIYLCKVEMTLKF